MRRFYINISISTLIGAAGIAYLWYRYRKLEKIPDKWEFVGYVEKIVFYPLKSCSYKELTEAECTEVGIREIKNSENANKFLLRDRQFVIYDIDKREVIKIVKQRKAILISVQSVDKDTVLFRAPNAQDYVLKISSVTALPKRVQIKRYGASIETVDCGDEAAIWFSRYLVNKDKGFRLGYFVENFSQKMNVQKVLLEQSKQFMSVYKHIREEDGGLYAWLTSYMIYNESSLHDLNQRLPPEDRISSYNFRPNIVIKGPPPYAEDDWKWIKVGDTVVMRYFKPCTRCATTTINPETAERNNNYQPIKMLNSYRKVKQVKGYDLQANLPVFGANMGLYATGRIKKGDPVYKNI